MSYIGLGLKPIWYYTYLNICNFFIKTFEREGNYIGDNLKVELESLNSSSPMVSRVKYILSKIDADINDDIEMKLNEYVVKSVNATLEKNCKTSFVIPKISYLDLNDPPLQRPQGISCKQMKTFYEFTFMSASLGNRNPLLGRAQTKLCPLCAVYFIYENLNEVHLLIDCKDMEYIRTSSGLNRFLDTTTATTTSRDK